MKQLSKNLTFLFLCFLLIGKISAQSYTISGTETVSALTSPTPLLTLSVCTDYKFTYQLSNVSSASTPVSDIITIDLPNGIQYSSFVSGTGATFTNLSGGASPTFLVAGWAANSAATLVIIAKTPPCNAISTPNSVSLIHGINSNVHAVSNNLQIVTPTLLAINNAGSGALLTNIGDVRELVFKVQNISTNGAEIPNINLSLSPDATISISPSGSAPFLGQYYLSTSATSPTGTNIYTYTLPPASASVSAPATIGSGISIGSADWNYFFSTTNFGPSQVLYIHVPYKVTTCASGGGTYTFTWGCGSTVCSTTTVNSNINVVTGNPSVAVAALNPPVEGTFCTSAGTTNSSVVFRYQNAGVPVAGAPFGNAKATDLKLYLYGEQSIGSLNTSTFKLVSGANILPLAYPSSYITNSVVTYSGKVYEIYELNLNNLTVALAGSWNPLGTANTLADLDGDGNVDDMAEGGIVNFSADYTYNPTCLFTAPCGGASSLISATQVKHNNQCFAIPATDPRQNPLNLGVNVANVSYNYTAIGGAASLTLPNDVQEGYGNAFNAILCTALYYERFAPIGFDITCPNGYHQIKYILAPGYHLNTTGLINVSGSTIGISTGVFQLPAITATARCGGSTQTITPTVQEFCEQGATPGYILVKFGRINSAACVPAYDETRDLPCINLPLFMDCQQSAPYFCSSTPANFGFDNMNFSLEYICDPGCSTCASPIACAGSTTYHHCTGLCDSYFSTNNDFKFTRKTLGFNNSNPLYSCTPITAPLTVSTQPPLDLQAAYPGDVINVAVTGSFSGTHTGYPVNTGTSYTDIYLQVRHDDISPASKRANFRLFDLDLSQGGITITNTTTSATLFVSSSALSYTCSLVSGRAEMNFNLSALGKAFISSSTDLYTFSSDIYLIARSTPANPGWPTFYAQGFYKLTSLRAEFMGTRPDPVTSNPLVDGSCDSWGASFTMLQPYSRVYVQAGASGTSTCGILQVKHTLQTQSARWGISQNDFSKEFRPYSTFDPNVTIEIPPGYIYLGSRYLITQSPYSSSDINGFSSMAPTFVSHTISGENVIGSPATGHTINYQGISGGSSCWPPMDLDYLLFYPEATILVELQPTCTALPQDTFKCSGGYMMSINQNNPAYQVHNTFNYSNSVVNHVNPVLSINPPASTINAFTNTLTFDFSICNNSVATANRPWIAIENSIVNGLNLAGASVQILPSGPILPVSTYLDGFGNTALMVNLPTTGTFSVLPVSTCYQLRLITTVDSNGCLPSGSGPVLDFITVKYGNECSGATPASPVLSCQQGSTQFPFQRYPSDLQLIVPSNGFPSAPVDLCNGALQYNFTINSSEIGSVTNPAFWMNLPTGISLQNITFTYPCGTTAYTATAPDASTFGTSGTLPGWNIKTHFPAINTNGLTGTTTFPNNQVCVTVNLLTSCAYNATDYIYFYAGGVSSCSQVLVKGPAQHRPSINNISPADNLSMALSMSTSDSAPIVNCDNTATYTVTVTNNGTTSNNHNNTVTVNLPAGPFTVNPGSGTLSAGTITWSLPSGSLNASASTTYTFSISLNGALYCQNNNAVSATFGYNQNVNCTASGGSCAVSYVSSPVQSSFDACCQCQMAISTTVSNAICNGTATGSATATVTGAALPVTYLWSDGQTTSTAVGLSAGTYSVIVTDANNCTINATVVITEPPAGSVTVTPMSAIICQGSSATLCASGALSYIWSDASTNACITVSPAITTTYSVTGADINGCTATASVTVSVLPLPTVTVTPNPVSICSGASATICASGASSYLWSDGSTSACITVSPMSNTTYTVTGSDGVCTSQPVTATVNVTPNPSLCMSPAQTLCSGNCTTISGACDGGLDPAVAYSWSPVAGLSDPGRPVTTACPTVTTTYSLTATNTITGCISTGMVTLTVVPTPTITVTPLTQTVCAGTTVSACASGATTYLWSNGATTPCISGTPMTAGTFTLSVTGFNGPCRSKAVGISVTVLVAPVLCMTPTQSICSGSCVTISGQCNDIQTHFLYSWSPSTGLSNPNALTTTACPTVTTTYTLTALNPGTGCVTTGTVLVNVTPTPTITVTPLTQTVCSGTAATICASGASTYVWSNGGITPCITVNPVSNTVYTVTGYNGSCASATLTSTVNVLPKPALCMSNPQSICSGSCVTISGRCPGFQAFVGYSWAPSTGVLNPNLLTTTACPTVTTTYTLTATNWLTGCTNTGTVTITVTPTPTVVVTPATQNICPGTSATICAGGASAYLWSTGSTAPCVTVTPTSNTVYSVTGYNGHCSGTTTATVNVLPKPSLCMSPAQTICSGGCTTISGKCHGIPFGVTYSWSPTTGLSNPNAVTTTACPTVTTVYTLTATNIFGCSTSGTVTVTVNSTPTLTVTPLTQTICAGTSASICASGASTYSWSNGSTTPCITGSPTAVGSHTISVAGSNGPCSSTVTATVTVLSKPVLCMSESQFVCKGNCVSLSGRCHIPQPGVIYSWNPIAGLVSPNAVTTTACPSVTTVYTLTATNTATGCTTSGTVTVTVFPTPTVTVTPATQTICQGSPAVICASGASAYAWNTGATTPCITVTPSSTTTYTVTGYNGFCPGTATATVNVIRPPEINIVGPLLVKCKKLKTYAVSPVITAPPTSYSWTATNASPSSGTGTTANIQFFSPGGTITWTATQAGNPCVGVATMNVVCIELPFDNSRIAAEDPEDETKLLMVYPNPNDGNFTIEYSLDGNSSGKVIIYDLLGKVSGIYDLSELEGKLMVRTEDLPNGTYIYKLISNEKILETGKIIIMK
jgi:hypothetical protein